MHCHTSEVLWDVSYIHQNQKQGNYVHIDELVWNLCHHVLPLKKRLSFISLAVFIQQNFSIN